MLKIDARMIDELQIALKGDDRRERAGKIKKLGKFM